MIKKDHYYSIQEARDILTERTSLPYSRVKVWRLAQEGEIKAVRYDAKKKTSPYYIKGEELIKYLNGLTN